MEIRVVATVAVLKGKGAELPPEAKGTIYFLERRRFKDGMLGELFTHPNPGIKEGKTLISEGFCLHRGVELLKDGYTNELIVRSNCGIIQRRLREAVNIAYKKNWHS